MLRIGLISDTHGLVRPEVHRVLAGVERILHAGDVGGDEILAELALIAPVEAVYGNSDAPGRPALVGEIVRELEGVTVHVSHGHELGVPTPAKLLARYPQRILVFGHTHRPLVVNADGRLVVNPGSAGPRRFHLSPTVAVLTVGAGAPKVEIVQL